MRPDKFTFYGLGHYRNNIFANVYTHPELEVQGRRDDWRPHCAQPVRRLHRQRRKMDELGSEKREGKSE